MEKLTRRKQISMIPFLQNIVFDLTFDCYMSSLECKNLAEQLLRMAFRNKYYYCRYSVDHSDMFNLHLTGLNTSEQTRHFLDIIFYPKLRRYYPNVFFHDKTFIDLFKKEDLIYLSPHATETIVDINPGSVFVIGGIVDRREIIELTFSKSKTLGLKSMCLPINNNQKWVKSLDDVLQFIYEQRRIKNKTKLYKD